jgi:hypothetical protein
MPYKQPTTASYNFAHELSRDLAALVAKYGDYRY